MGSAKLSQRPWISARWNKQELTAETQFAMGACEVGQKPQETQRALRTATEITETARKSASDSLVG